MRPSRAPKRRRLLRHTVFTKRCDARQLFARFSHRQIEARLLLTLFYSHAPIDREPNYKPNRFTSAHLFCLKSSPNKEFLFVFFCSCPFCTTGKYDHLFVRVGSIRSNTTERLSKPKMMFFLLRVSVFVSPMLVSQTFLSLSLGLVL